MSNVKSFEDLRCWQKSRELVCLVYKLSDEGKLAQDFEAKDQIRRAALSVMNNIAEGFGRESHKEFTRFLEIAHASCIEVKSITYVLQDLNYLPQSSIDELHAKANEVRGLIRGLMKYLRETPKSS